MLAIKKGGSITMASHLIMAFLFAVSVFPAALNAQQPLIEELDKYLQACHEVYDFHGAVLIGKDGRVFYKKGIGMANIELGVPNTPEMKFQIGSITKQFTATAIMQLAEKGLLSVDDPITKYITDYPSETGNKITIHNLLTHTSGVTSYTSMPDVMERRAVEISIEDLIALFKDLPLEFEPGTQFNYSNSGYVLLGAIIENVSGMPYEDHIQKNIFDPLGMKNSGYCHRDMILENRACGYTENEEGELLNAGYVHMSMPYSAGALYSTVEDMFLWDQALYTEKILTKASLEKMFTPFLDNYAYGWGVTEVKGHKLISHGGGIDGFATEFQRWVEDSGCVVVFSNNDAAQPGQIAIGLASIMVGEPYEMPVKKTPIVIDEIKLKEYAGVFRINDTEYRIISFEKGQLYSQRTGGGRIAIYPEAEDNFFYDHDHHVTLKFNRDQSGEIVSHTIYQNFDYSDAQKVGESEANEVLEAMRPAEIDPALLEKYAGAYELNPNFIMNVLSKDDKLFIQAGNYPELEIIARSETEFNNPDHGVNITFNVDNNGKVISLVFQQGNTTMTGKKIE
jgi:CubicO group peptidase (beta-lactamase class C family)